MTDPPVLVTDPFRDTFGGSKKGPPLLRVVTHNDITSIIGIWIVGGPFFLEKPFVCANTVDLVLVHSSKVG